MTPFEHLIAANRTSFTSYARTFTRNYDDAEDVVEDTIIKAWKAFETFDQSRPFAPWFKAILRRVAIDRSRLKRNSQETSFPLDMIAWIDADQDVIGVSPQLQERLHTALLSLPDDERKLVEMRHIEGRTMRSISAIMGCCKNTANRKLKSAMANVRLAMAELGE